MIPLDLTSNAAWRQRYRAASISWVELASANPERGVVCTNQDGIFQLYAWDVPTGRLQQITHESAGITSGLISADGNSIFYHQDSGGNEIGHFVRLPFEGGDPQDVTPDLPAYSTRGMYQSHSGSTLGFTTADREGFSIYTLKIGGAAQKIHHSPNMAYGPILSQDGEIAVLASTDRSGTTDYSLLAMDTRTGQPVAELWDGEGTSVQMEVFSPVPGDFRLLGMSSRSGYPRPFVWNPQTGERIDLSLDAIPGAIFPWSWSPDGRKALIFQLYQAQFQIFVYDFESQKATRLAHPAGVMGGFFPGFFSPDGEIWVTWQDSSHPSCLIALDASTGEFKRTILNAGEPPEGRSFRSIEFVSENGDLVQGWLAVPEGEGPFPTILHTHGGPTAVQALNYFPAAQAWLDHGFAFCTINYHGSETFGKTFEKSIQGNLGDLEVQDMAAAYHWLVDQQVARPEAVFPTGASYGGYLTLQALGRRPELWAGGMAVVAIADWKSLYEDEADTLRGLQRAMFGGAPQDVPEATRKSSPITYADQIRSPILVIQGENDTRCPPRQMRQYEEKLKSLGKDISVSWFDAGHGSRAQEQQIAQQELMLKFAYRVLSGD